MTLATAWLYVPLGSDPRCSGDQFACEASFLAPTWGNEVAIAFTSASVIETCLYLGTRQDSGVGPVCNTVFDSLCSWSEGSGGLQVYTEI